MIQSAGFEPVAYQRLGLKPSQRALWNHCILMGMEELCLTLETSGTNTPQALAMRQSLEQLSDEFEIGASIDVQWFYMVGRRAPNI
ncbi:uncharacterized protein N7483_008718 [Penicillium malachiteum]|uniref:uncharacterized protein n=1 Tax=Penicillium malachiteum TaxID=1324776 RepID=UPI002546B804|nr:uncharacterized protein N7483_008718 [Penicillium malachiteum]KAJ5720784.1 hypothetical protein N7483_008718 [Penicillium malachiteum]